MVDHPHRAFHEGHGQEHRHQNQGNANDRAGDLAHGLFRCVARRQAFLAHDPLDVLDHDNGVVDQDADSQHHAKQGQDVDRKAQRKHHRKSAGQRYRHYQGRYQGIADVLQEQEHHREHQGHGFKQGGDYLLDRDFDERRGVVGNVELRPWRQVARQFLQFGADQGGGFHGIGAG
ncbi:hypothetical protein D3C77_143390 [compost metagenome]